MRVGCLLVLAVAAAIPLLSATVPFVGCASDGQTGPIEAPTGKSKQVEISAASAQRLAWYESDLKLRILAPRGWHCFRVYGSSGEALYVSPEPVNAARLFGHDWTGFAGPLIEISHSDGDTFGRYAVAEIIARMFPAYKQFVTSLIEGGLASADEYPSGPYPITGVTILIGPTPDLLHLAIRLPAQLSDLTSTIIEEVERTAGR